MLSAVRAEELAPGLVRWEAFHPEWKRDVACVLLEDPDGLVLVDPLAPPELRAARRFWRALDSSVRAAAGRVDVVLTLHYHLRSAPAVLERYGRAPGASLWVPAGSEERIGAAAPERVFAPGDRLPGGLQAFPCGRPGEVVLWAAERRAVIAGDVLLGGVRRPLRVCPASWLPRSVTRGDVARALAPLLELPVELVVPLHGPPVQSEAGAALAAALAEAGASSPIGHEAGTVR
jgi:glyoxylase-like metal-dependent hydrolase (beta-lactamase superfamily II)